jgi:hypothetical protein
MSSETTLAGRVKRVETDMEAATEILKSLTQDSASSKRHNEQCMVIYGGQFQGWCSTRSEAHQMVGEKFGYENSNRAFLYWHTHRSNPSVMAA